MTTVPINAFLVLGFGAAAIASGHAWHARCLFVRRWLIPPPILAGFILAVLTMILRWAGYALDVDGTIQQIAMVALFTSIGFNLDRPTLRAAGRPAAILLLMFAFGAAVQNTIGVAIAARESLHPLIGIAAGAVAFAGGPATSLAFGPTLEAAGAAGATSVALASSIAGIFIAGLITGGFGGFLIRRYGLNGKPLRRKPALPATRESPGVNPELLAGTLLLFAFTMGLGHLLHVALERGLKPAGISLPAYVGSMLVAACIRSTAVAWRRFGVPKEWNDAAGATALTWFIPLALWTLRYWELRRLAAPVLVIVIAQLPVTLVLSWAVFRLLGKTYDSAVMSAGFFGFMYGTMANSLAAMNEIEERFGRSQAFLIISVSGGVLSDLANVLVIVISRVVVQWSAR